MPKIPQTVSILFDSDKMYTQSRRCRSNVDIINKDSDTKAKTRVFHRYVLCKRYFLFKLLNFSYTYNQIFFTRRIEYNATEKSSYLIFKTFSFIHRILVTLHWSNVHITLYLRNISLCVSDCLAWCLLTVTRSLRQSREAGAGVWSTEPEPRPGPGPAAGTITLWWFIVVIIAVYIYDRVSPQKRNFSPATAL